MFRESHKGAHITYTPTVPRDIPIKAVLFDIGGVVIEWTDNIIYEYIAERFGLDFKGVKAKISGTLLQKLERGDIGEKELWTQFFSSYGMPLPKDWKEMWVRKLKECAKLNADVIEIAKKLKDAYRVGVITNTEPSHDAWARKVGWYKYFDTVIVSYKERCIKPEPKIYMVALKRLNMEAEECILVDNKEENIRGAEAVGMKGILFSNSRDGPEKLRMELRKHGIEI